MPTPLSEWHHFLTYFPLDQASWPFKASTNLTAPLLLYYSGVLPVTPTLRHLFLVSQLKGTDTESLGNQVMPRPKMFDRQASHDFTMLYSNTMMRNRRELLFHFQISGSDLTAKQLAYFLVEAFQNARENSRAYLGDRQYHSFWTQLASNKLDQLKADSRTWSDSRPLVP
ncbi:MAG: hypothetical protein VKL20_08345 [Synechocystis sp.]|nr:hypothetical protein [Synechocystis sp.]